MFKYWVGFINDIWTKDISDFCQALDFFSGLDSQDLEFYMAGEYSLYLKTLKYQIHCKSFFNVIN